jgi:hypothetical protein
MQNRIVFFICLFLLFERFVSVVRDLKSLFNLYFSYFFKNSIFETIFSIEILNFLVFQLKKTKMTSFAFLVCVIIITRRCFLLFYT